MNPKQWKNQKGMLLVCVFVIYGPKLPKMNNCMFRTFLPHFSHVHLSVWLLQMCVLEFRLVVIAIKGRRRIMLIFTCLHTQMKRERERKKRTNNQNLYSLYQFPLTQPMDENKLSICVRCLCSIIIIIGLSRWIQWYQMDLSYCTIYNFVKLSNVQRNNEYHYIK